MNEKKCKRILVIPISSPFFDYKKNYKTYNILTIAGKSENLLFLLYVEKDKSEKLINKQYAIIN